MTLLDTSESATDGTAAERRRPSPVEPAARVLPRRRRRAGLASTVFAVAAELVWLSWWMTHFPVNPIAAAILLAEIAGLVGTVAISLGLARARRPRQVFVDDPRESHRFAFAVADIVGRTRSTDVHRDVVRVVRTPRRPQRSAEAAMGAVLLEGPRRLLLVVSISLALLLGISPMPVPPVWALVSIAAASMSAAVAHVVLADGRIRIGDRTRWSFSSIGEVVGAADLEGIAPRRWVGTMAAIVVVNLAIALRGTSDRWTHGLDPMTDDQRVVTMALGIGLVVGALFTMRTSQAPMLDGDRWSRRLEERTARQSALGATVVLGLIGLIAGVLPGGVDAADDDRVRIEHVVDDETRTVDG